jgi:hypothetical protein
VTPSAGLVDLRTLERGRAAVFDRSVRVVGWGTGSVFDYFHGLYPIRLDGLVDSDASRWGQRRHGIDIGSPALLTEDSDRPTFVVIYSGAWPEIQEAIAGLGAFPSLPASAVFADATATANLSLAESLANSAPPRRVPSSDNAIVVQGPLVPGITARALGAMAARHPRDLLVLSTWSDSDPALLHEVAPLVDEVVTTPRPASPGVQNRNCQIVSTRAGIERAIARGARRVLKTRTDLVVLEPDLFARATWWTGQIDCGAARRAGLAARLIVPSTFTRKYFLYHPSDLVMLGEAGDLLAFWSAPLDPRGGSLLSADWIDQPLAVANMSGHPAESYLGGAFCRTIGRAMAGTVADSWAFYRDLFAVVDNDWFGMLWFKHLAIPDAAIRRGIRQTVSHAFWERLQTDALSLASERDDVDPALISLRVLTGAAA